MKKDKSVTLKDGEVPARLTRARAAAFRASGQLPPLKGVPEGIQKQPSRANPKRAVSDNTFLPRKKRAVLQDVSNICCESSYRSCSNTTKVQDKKSKMAKPAQLKVPKVVSSVSGELPQLQVVSKAASLPQMGLRSEDSMCSFNLEGSAALWPSAKQCGTDDNMFDSQTSGISSNQIRGLARQSGGGPVPPASQTVAAKKGSVSELQNVSKGPDFIDIDADFEDPQLCGLYATDIYNNFRVAELSRRPYNFIESVQRDITQSMRGILVDWLVEVSEEYRLGADTLYLTVYLIDWFLSKNYIERQRLQLLGITCMLIASKYEEINAPRIEEFCFITDNTYSKEEVLKMETEVLKSSAYQLFAPTTKTFLRRFLRAAQASYKSPSLELEYLANYLAELTLMNYGFLSFLPSMIAASAVFLARWTLDQSSHPWNPTLQHYASYEASDMKTTVVALQDLQLNIDGCPLTAIRTKYTQEKFKGVAALTSPKLLETLF